jgi:TM2 domain-containing membrane protein YozV
MIGNYRKAENMFIGLSENSLLSEQAILEIFKTRFFSKDYSGLRNLFRNSNELPNKLSPEIKQLYYTSYLFDSEPLLENESFPLEEDFLNAFPISEQSKMNEFFQRKKDPQYKRPLSAALLSTIIPGAGKIYTKQYGDAITAFIVTGLLGYFAVDNFHSKHDFRAGIFTGLGLIFYAGNIYGSAASAQIYNAGINYNFEHDLKVFLNANNFFSSHYENFCK